MVVGIKLNNDRGSIFVISLLVMASLLGIAAIALDLGMHVLAIKQIQQASDAAALAAVAELRNGFDAANEQVSIDSINAAKDAAVNTARFNRVIDQNAAVNPDNVVVGSYDDQTKQFSTPFDPTIGNVAVKVTINATVPYWFGKIFGVSSKQITSIPSIATLKIMDPNHPFRSQTVAVLIVPEASGDIKNDTTTPEWQNEVAAVSTGLNDINKSKIPGDQAGMSAVSSFYAYNNRNFTNNGPAFNVATVDVQESRGGGTVSKDLYDAGPGGWMLPGVTKTINNGDAVSMWRWMASAIKYTTTANYVDDLRTVGTDGNYLDPVSGGQAIPLDTNLVSLNGTPNTLLPTSLNQMLAISSKDNPLGGLISGAVINTSRERLDMSGADKKILIYVSKNIPYSLIVGNPTFSDSQYQEDAVLQAGYAAADGIVMDTITLEPSGTAVYDFNSQNLTKNGGYALKTTDSAMLPTLMDTLIKLQTGRPSLEK